jgi:hypothetical protein
MTSTLLLDKQFAWLQARHETPILQSSNPWLLQNKNIAIFDSCSN